MIMGIIMADSIIRKLCCLYLFIKRSSEKMPGSISSSRCNRHHTLHQHHHTDNVNNIDSIQRSEEEVAGSIYKEQSKGNTVPVEVLVKNGR